MASRQTFFRRDVSETNNSMEELMDLMEEGVTVTELFHYCGEVVAVQVATSGDLDVTLNVMDAIADHFNRLSQEPPAPVREQRI
jgi:hypothetical protein